MHKKTIEDFMKLNPHTIKYSIYKHRIQRWLDKTLDSMLWLAKNFPDVFLNVENLGNKRMKILLLTLKCLMGDNINVELIKEAEKEK